VSTEEQPGNRSNDQDDSPFVANTRRKLDTIFARRTICPTRETLTHTRTFCPSRGFSTQFRQESHREGLIRLMRYEQLADQEISFRLAYPGRLMLSIAYLRVAAVLETP
jgi:hypothetical protein